MYAFNGTKTKCLNNIHIENLQTGDRTLKWKKKTVVDIIVLQQWLKQAQEMGWYVTKNGKYSQFPFKMMTTKKKIKKMLFAGFCSLLLFDSFQFILAISLCKQTCDIYSFPIGTILMKDANSFLRFNKYWLPFLSFGVLHECVKRRERNVFVSLQNWNDSKDVI